MKPISEIMKSISIPESTSTEGMPRTSENGDSCVICGGAGWVRFDAPVGSPNFGRLVPCVCKQEDRWRQSAVQSGQFGSLSNIATLTFEQFDPEVKGAGDAYEAATTFASDPHNWLLLVGDYGCGKTHLAAAIANYARTELHMWPVFAIVPDLLDYLRSAFSPDSDTSYESKFEAIRSADLLVLDDLGTESSTPWAQEKLFQIVNTRYMERMPTVITTNVDLDRLEGRVRSRLLDGDLTTHVFITSGDYRSRGVVIPKLRNRRK